MNNSVHPSQNSIEEFNEQKKAMSIGQYRLFIFILCFINASFIIFFICLNWKISSFKQDNSSLSNQINQKERSNTLISLTVNHQLLNLLTLQKVFHKEEITLIYSIAEFNTILSWINSKCYQVFLCFTSNNRPSFGSYDIFEYCNINHFLVFIIKTTKGNRFGGVVKIYEYSAEDEEVTQSFLFNLDSKKKFYPKKGKEALFYVTNQETKVSFGEDLVIHRNTRDFNSSYSKFPRQYGEANDSLIDFTGGEEYFAIEKLEILNSQK